MVIAIEPDPKNFDILRKNILLNNLRNVRTFNLAAWSKKDKLKLFIGDFSAWHSAKTNFGQGYFVVQALTLDEILNQVNVKKITFVKIDVEGAELEVLKGFSDSLSRLQPSIIVEIWEKDKPRLEQIRAFAIERKLDFKRIGPDYYLISPIE